MEIKAQFIDNRMVRSQKFNQKTTGRKNNLKNQVYSYTLVCNKQP